VLVWACLIACLSAELRQGSQTYVGVQQEIPHQNSDTLIF